MQKFCLDHDNTRPITKLQTQHKTNEDLIIHSFSLADILFFIYSWGDRKKQKAGSIVLFAFSKHSSKTMETAITRERMIKMTTLPAVLNQLLLSITSTQHTSLVMSLPRYRIIQKHASI